MYEAYKDKVIFLVVYVREAHPAKGDATAENAGWKQLKDKDGGRDARLYASRMGLARNSQLIEYEGVG